MKALDGLIVQSDIAGEGQYAARVEFRPGDENVAGSGFGLHSEVFIGNPATDGAYGREQLCAWSTYFPTDFDAPAGAWNAFTHFHQAGATGQENIQFAVVDRARLEPRAMGGSTAAPSRRDFVLGRLTKGRWYDFVLHVKWSSTKEEFVCGCVDAA